MDTISDILDYKGEDVFSIHPSATIEEAVERMCADRVGALLVCDEGKTVGILSERDVMKRVLLEHRATSHTRVHEAMTRDVVCVRSSAPLEQAMALMTEHRCRHLPVIDDGQLRGVVSIGDLVRAISVDQRFEIQVLTEYIVGAHPSA